jgi:biopolymer transport protein ExbD
MAFGSFDSGAGNARPMAEINMIPLIDVMLVLLVIFIITAPFLTHAVKIDLPKAASTPNLTKPENIQLAINDAGTIFWNGEPVDRKDLRERLAAAGRQQPQPEVHIRADQTARYRWVAEVLADSASAGLTRIGFVSDPDVGKLH